MNIPKPVDFDEDIGWDYFDFDEDIGFVKMFKLQGRMTDTTTALTSNPEEPGLRRIR